MPTYEYHCDSCEADFSKVLRISEYADPQECPECGEGPARKMVTGCSFILTGDDWASKSGRVSRQMAAKNRRLDAKQEVLKRETGIRLAPNVGGEQVASWSEASKLAKSLGKDTSGYEQRARKEDSTK